MHVILVILIIGRDEIAAHHGDALTHGSAVDTSGSLLYNTQMLRR